MGEYRRGSSEEKGGPSFILNGLCFLCGGGGQVTGLGERRGGGKVLGEEGRLRIKGEVREGLLMESKEEPVTQERAAE